MPQQPSSLAQQPDRPSTSASWDVLYFLPIGGTGAHLSGPSPTPDRASHGAHIVALAVDPAAPRTSLGSLSCAQASCVWL
ncbi:hypothetical protein E2562_003125 [Oryza meyeriana var. granulata]|uniref:Uncharacterized protein n=1 Tax=Oryza meyeriana var. granulata TaxID=110450 RepID=A0A6G1E896_9ORYZ|nr:hypothetical protein E2562_003125 [Oryza meyeriana var. granulata]